MKYIIGFTAFLTFFLLTFTLLGQPFDSVGTQNTLKEIDTFKTQNELSEFRPKIINWNPVDSQILLNRIFFRSKRGMETDTENGITESYNFSEYRNFYYILFLIFVLLNILYARVFPTQYLVNLKAFFHRPSMSTVLHSENSWVSPEKLFPFAILLIFLSAWIVAPIANHFVFEEANWLVLIISILFFCLLFVILRLIQITLSNPLDFDQIMARYTRISFHTLFHLSVFLFPIAIALLSIFDYNLFDNVFNILITIAFIYTFRTLRSFLMCLRFEPRQIIYLIIYLCTLEIPMLVVGFMWIRDNLNL